MTGPATEAWLDEATDTTMSARPALMGFLLDRGIEIDPEERRPLATCLLEHLRGDVDALHTLATAFRDHQQRLDELVGAPPEVRTLTIVTGRDKTGRSEGVESLTLRRGDVLAVVGPTGSGKSRLLADIEWMAVGDTPTGRRVLIDGQPASLRDRHIPSKKLVAQLSQTMSFVVDLAVGEFIQLHAECRGLSDVTSRVAETLDLANQLSGEAFKADAPVAALSGGQSRALMIADVAVLGRSPVVLVDEIENAGIDRRRALDLLVARDKIVLLVTHDPLLALLAPRRAALRNGGIHAVIDRDADELSLLGELEGLEQRLLRVRSLLRAGMRATEEVSIP